MKSSGAYEVVGHEQIAVERLTLHPAAEMPIDEDDGLALQDSIAERGVVDHPLIVLADTLQVVDGCNRLAGARAAGIEKVWCQLIRTNDVRSIVLDSLSIGRQRTSGQRILAFIEMNQDAVMDAYEQGLAAKEANQKRGNSRSDHVIGPENNPFHQTQIAKRLHVSEMDVRNAITLTAAALNAEDEKKQECALAIMRRVYAGQTPVRRCTAGLGGKNAGQKGKADANYTEIGYQSISSLANMFRHWKEIAIADRHEMEVDWLNKVVPVLPESFVELLVNRK